MAQIVLRMARSLRLPKLFAVSASEANELVAETWHSINCEKILTILCMVIGYFFEGRPDFLEWSWMTGVMALHPQ
jgi:hypothetical protein